MAAGSSPRSAPSASRVIPAFTADHDASSGRGAEDTPSQTMATATGPWSLSATTLRPQDGQYPSSPAKTGSAESVEHAVHIFALGESSRDVLIAESPLLSAWRRSARQDISLCPPGSGRHFFLFGRGFLGERTVGRGIDFLRPAPGHGYGRLMASPMRCTRSALVLPGVPGGLPATMTILS